MIKRDPRFDPMMEEKKGWIVGEAPWQDNEMAEAIMQVMEEASNQQVGGEINPFKAMTREVLLLDVERNFCGFMV